MLWLLAATISCTAQPDDAGRDPAVSPPVRPPTADTDPPWVRSGESGDFMLIRSAPTSTASQEVRVAALFGQGIQGSAFPAACSLEQRLCVDTDEVVDHDRYLPAGPVSADRFSWLGDRLAIGPHAVPFQVQPDGPAGYHGTLGLQAPLTDRLRVRYERGEWGAGAFDIELPSLFDEVEPPATNVVTDPTGLTPFRWKPEGGDVYLTLTGPDWSSTRRIEDDGVVWVDTRGFRFGASIEVRLSRVTEQGEVPIDTHTVRVRGLVEHAWCVTDGCPEKPFVHYPRPLEFDYCWSASNCNHSAWRLEEDGTWTTGSSTGEWTFDCCQQRIEFVFSSGTRYWATLQPDGCYDGEMLSWSGNRGTWSACPL